MTSTITTTEIKNKTNLVLEKYIIYLHDNFDYKHAQEMIDDDKAEDKNDAYDNFWFGEEYVRNQFNPETADVNLKILVNYFKEEFNDIINQVDLYSLIYQLAESYYKLMFKSGRINGSLEDFLEHMLEEYEEEDEETFDENKIITYFNDCVLYIPNHSAYIELTIDNLKNNIK